MSPESKRTFELEWVVLSRRLRMLLARKGVNPNLHDDLVQETALRLLSMWDVVDRRRPLWPLTVTIALNLLRDRGRVVTNDDLVAEIPEFGGVHDVEAAGLARVELARVRRAMGELSGSQRSALMKEIGGHALATEPDSSGDKMLRMRARRKLKMALENVSGLVAFRLRRFFEMAEAALAAKDGALSAASCVFCLVIGFGATVGRPASLTPHASARPVQNSSAGRWVGSTGNVSLVGTSASHHLGDVPRAGSAAVSDDVRTTGSGAKGKANDKQPGGGLGSGGDGEDEGDGLLGVLPQDDDQVGPPPTDDVYITLDAGDPAPGPDDDQVPPPRDPPAQPPGSSPVSNEMSMPPLIEDAEKLF